MRDELELHYVTSEEGWEGIYVNGTMWMQHHSIGIDQLLDLVTGKVVKSVLYTHLEGPQNERLETVGQLPETEEELLTTW